MLKEIILNKEFKNEKLEELMDRVKYISEYIKDIKYEKNDHKLILLLDEHSQNQINDLVNTITALIDKISNNRIIKSTTIFDNTEKDHKPSFQLEEQVSQNFYEEDDLALLSQLDSRLLEIANKYGAVQREYPTTLDYKSMNKNKYHRNFPQHIFSVFSLPHNYGDIEKIRMSEEIPNNIFKSSNKMLRPCICYHAYEELENTKVAYSKVFTSKGKCFRKEAPYKLNRFRKEEFWMREIIFFGSKEEVLNIREQIMLDVWEMFDSFKIPGRIVTANDPFFFYDDLIKSSYQIMSKSKYELEALLSPESKVSIGSFNYCDDHLCLSYNIKSMNEEKLYSGCVAFGLDRWLEVFKYFNIHNL